MNGIEKITARIETEAKAEVDGILREGEEKAAAIRKQYETQAVQESKAAAEAGREAAKRQLERLESAAQMDAKKQMLATKQDVLNSAFDKVQAHLLALPDEEYAELLAEMAVKASRTGKEEIILSARDHKRVGEMVVSKANGLKKGAAMTLSKQTREMAGGLTLRSGSVEINCAFETQMRVLREEMAAEVAGILFS